MKKTNTLGFLFAALSLLAAEYQAFASNETGPANTVMRVGASGGRGKFGAVDLSQAAAVGSSVLRPVNGAFHSSNQIANLSVAASVGSNALTIALKDAAGSDCSATSPCKVGMRSSTSTSGVYNIRSVTGALSLVISSGSTLGHSSGNNHNIHVYLIDNAGTLELAASTYLFDEGSLISTTAEGGAGAADSQSVMYSANARSNVPFRLIARMVGSQATAGTWASVPTEIAPKPFEFDSGTYTPTVTNVANTNSIVASPSWWIRVGNIVLVHGIVDYNTTADAASVTISLPLKPTTFVNASDASGVLNDGGISGWEIFATAGAQTVTVSTNTGNSSSNGSKSFSFMYRL